MIIQYHQASFATDVKGTYIVKKYKRRKMIYKINPNRGMVRRGRREGGSG